MPNAIMALSFLQQLLLPDGLFLRPGEELLIPVRYRVTGDETSLELSGLGGIILFDPAQLEFLGYEEETAVIADLFQKPSQSYSEADLYESLTKAGKQFDTDLDGVAGTKEGVPFGYLAGSDALFDEDPNTTWDGDPNWPGINATDAASEAGLTLFNLRFKALEEFSGSPLTAIVTTTHKGYEGAGDETNITVENASPTTFRALSVRTLLNGLAITLPEAPDMGKFNLYDGRDKSIDEPDAVLKDSSNKTVQLSAHWDPGSSELSLLANAALKPGNYTLSIDSGENGLVSADTGKMLDGDGDGIAGDSFYLSYQAILSEVALSLGDTTRGPGQRLALNGSGTHDQATGQPLIRGLPVKLDSTISVDSITGSLSYNNAIFSDATLISGTDLPEGWSLTLETTSTPGEIRFNATGSTSIKGNNLELFRFDAIVGAISSGGTTPYHYGDSELVKLTASAKSANAAIEVSTDPGLVILAYPGDTSGNGTLGSLDASNLLRVSAGLDSGFDAYDDINPALIGDTSGNGSISALDGSRILQQVVGLPVSSFPKIPEQLL